MFSKMCGCEEITGQRSSVRLQERLVLYGSVTQEVGVRDHHILSDVAMKFMHLVED